LLCLLTAMHAGTGRSCLVIGDVQTGCVITPDCVALRAELEQRCLATQRDPGRWVCRVQFDAR